MIQPWNVFFLYNTYGRTYVCTVCTYTLCFLSHKYLFVYVYVKGVCVCVCVRIHLYVCGSACFCVCVYVWECVYFKVKVYMQCLCIWIGPIKGVPETDKDECLLKCFKEFFFLFFKLTLHGSEGRLYSYKGKLQNICNK